ncbi:MAG: OmpA family protein [Vicingaceae bacterium]
MKKITFLSAVLFISTFAAYGQMIIPEFNTPILIEEISSDDEESMPLPFNEGNGFYFYRTYYGGPENNIVKGQDIWISEMKKKGWGDPYRLFRADFIEGSSTIFGTSADGTRIYVLITKYMETTTERKIGYYDQTGKDKWGSFNEIKIEGFQFEEKFYHFYMTQGEEILLISMSPETNRLNEDLYVSLKVDGKWRKPIELGETINTPKIEMAPYMGNDNKLLYFSSEGHGGLGESDIFVSRRLDDTWTNWTPPVNMGAPINSEGFEDFFIIGNGSKVFFTSSRGAEYSSIYEAIATGTFRYAFADSIIGEFIFNSLPADNVTLEIFDEEDNLLVELKTDEEGKFVYKKLSADQVIMVKIKADDGEDFIGAKMYLSDSNGKRNKRLIFTKVGMFVEEDLVKEREKIQGVFNYNNLPMKNSALVLYDENGFPVDTIYTDEFGNFSYNKIAYDNNFTLIPLNESDDFTMVDLYLTNEAGVRTFNLASKNDKFTFIPAGEKAAEIALSPPLDKTAESKTLISKSASVKDQWNGMGVEDKTVYFEFAKNQLNPKAKDKLDQIAKLLEADNSLKVEIIGHTDDVGSEESNQERGLDRAIEVKGYLNSKVKVNSAAIEVKSEGELKPIASNKSVKGRAKNRRVEINLR